jgi:hypothetical protein
MIISSRTLLCEPGLADWTDINRAAFAPQHPSEDRKGNDNGAAC